MPYLESSLRVIGISIAKEGKKPRLSEEQKRQQSCALIVVLILTLIFAFFLITAPPFAAIFVVFYAMVIVFMLLPRDRVPRSLKRIRRDIDRRAHFPAGGYGKGVISFEDGGPTKPPRDEEDY
ncbi:MAG: hypothetical protein ACFE9D_12320 [Promethearchaeota archaeon]